ncbi:MAG TPA: potassium-transporting ATPase subunit C, partial [Caulobacteraceae bacterium]|nr:potassium-transporting ATPase subunit C [Caulobacteraceae bacterium]
DVSPANAHLQADRIAGRRGATVSEVLAVIDANTAQPTLGFLGEPRVNVLAVNRALDARYPVAQPKA